MLARNTLLQHRYRIIRPLGRGGMGHVYEAIDDSVDSIVAIKETFADTDRLRRAFEREAKLLANLKHPALPRVMHHFVEGSGQFLVMEFIEGLNLAELLKLRARPLSYSDVLPWTDKLLGALEYLHGQPEPVIHRDIKPANIKVSSEGDLYLLDFGLAKGAVGQTTSGLYGYTAAYAPLEQLNNSSTTAQSDLYSLGATLHHLLTGHVPVQASIRYEQIEDGKPDPLSPAHEINWEVPLGFSLIISQAMAMRRRDRFASAAIMREALGEAKLSIARELEKKIFETPTEPMLHRTESPSERDRRFPVQASTALPVEKNQELLQTIDAKPPVVPPPPIDPFASPEISWPSQIGSEASDSRAEKEEQEEAQLRQAQKEAEEIQQREQEEQRQREAAAAAAIQREAEEKQRLEAEARRREKEIRQKQSEEEEQLKGEAEAVDRLRAAEEAARQDKAAENTARQSAAQAATAPRQETQSLAELPARREKSWVTRRRWLIGYSVALLAGLLAVFVILYSSSENKPSTDSSNSTSVKSSPLALLTFKQDLDGQQAVAWSVAFSPDGNSVASAGGDRKVRFWDARSWKLMDFFGGHGAGVNSIDFAPDNKTMASASNDKKVRLLTQGIRGATNNGGGAALSGHTDEVYFVDFSPDGKLVASASKDKTVKLWSVPDEKELMTLTGHTDVVWSVAFSSDSKTLASASKDGTIKLWDVRSGKELRTLSGHTGPVISIAFSPDGKMLASGGDDKTIKLWITETWQELGALVGHTEYVTSVAFSPDGNTLASASNDKTVRLWDVQTAQARQTLTGHSQGVTSVSFSPDGKTLISGGKDETVKLWQ